MRIPGGTPATSLLPPRPDACEKTLSASTHAPALRSRQAPWFLPPCGVWRGYAKVLSAPAVPDATHPPFRYQSFYHGAR